MRGVEATVEAVGRESGIVKALGGEPMTHLLGETYYTQGCTGNTWQRSPSLHYHES